MERENHRVKALNLLRTRICDPKFIVNDSPDTNYRSQFLLTDLTFLIFMTLLTAPISHFSKLKFMISSSVTEACNNSILLLGPRGSGKNAVCSRSPQPPFKGFLHFVYIIMFSLVRFWSLSFKICCNTIRTPFQWYSIIASK